MTSIKCFKCKRLGHYGYQCFKEEKQHDPFYGEECERCLKCGRIDHVTYKCYESKDIFGRKFNRNSYKINKKRIKPKSDT